MTYEALGEQIKTEREKQGWDQALLANMMNVGQQAVSRWEKGKSRPKIDDLRKLVDLFGADVDGWLSTAGYEHSLVAGTLLPFLPLEALSEEDFELFCKMLVGFLTKSEAHRYGRRGDKQYGIDIYVKMADGKNSYQCKRHRQFGAKDVHAAVTADTYGAKRHFLLLSRQATTDARDAMDTYDDWELWDKEDLSTKIRSLSNAEQLTLIDAFFPRLRKDFLGIDDPSIWLTREQFFQTLTDTAKLFSHGWGFVGRTGQLKVLDDFLATDDNDAPKAIVLSGPGGVGKSRLLREWSANAGKTHQIRFVTVGADVQPKDFEDLPKGPAVLVVDDAHERPDLLPLLDGIGRFRPQTKIVLSSRTYAVPRIQEQLFRSGVPYRDESLVTLGALNNKEAEALSREIVTELDGDLQYIEAIARITKDCPLLTIIGSRLVALGQIRPELLNNSEEFRKRLLAKFSDVIAGDIGGAKDAENIQELLAFIAMVQPIDQASPAFYPAAEKVLGLRADKVARLIRILEDAGVLLRRSSGVRITPDLLADYIRADRSYDDRTKLPTGYADEVFKAAAESNLAVNLLVNLSQLDWRLSVDGTQTAILAEVWGILKEQFVGAKIYGREAIMTALEKVSYYQPEPALELVRLAIDNPIDEAEEDPLRMIWSKPSYQDVRSRLAPVLRYIAYHEKYLFEALDSLKVLAEQDRRQPNQYPDHPLRVTKDIAAIEPGKPASFNERIVEHVLTWDDDDTKDFSPFDILDELLATEGHQSKFSGKTLTLSPYRIRVEAVAPLRKQIIDAAFNNLHSSSLKKAIRATKTLAAAISGPSSIGGMDVNDADQAAWEPSILEVMDRLEEVVADTTVDPLVALEIRSAVSWHAAYGKGATNGAAKKVLSAIPATTDYELSRALVDGWGWSFVRKPDGGARDDEALDAWRKELAQRLVTEYQSDYMPLIKKIEARLATLATTELHQRSDAGPFTAVLMQSSTDFGEAVARHILATPTSPLANLFAVVINVVAQADQNKALELAKQGVATGNPMLLRCVSSSLGWGLYNKPLTDVDLEIAKTLVRSDELIIRRNIVRVVRRFAPADKALAIELLLSIKFSDSKEVADDVLGELHKVHGGLYEVNDLSGKQVSHIMKELLALKSIDDYNIELFLRDLSLVDPDTVLQLLFDRVDHLEARDDADPLDRYEAVPYQWESRPPMQFHERKDYGRLLRKVRDWVAEKPNSWQRHHYGADIFKLVSTAYDGATLLVLEEAIMSHDRQQLENAAVLLSEADRTFVWDKAPYIINLLDEAQKHGAPCYKRVVSWLMSSVLKGGRSGVPGQPFPEDIEQRDRSEELMSKLPVGSPAQRFYKSLYDSAVAAIQRDQVEDEDDEDN